MGETALSNFLTWWCLRLRCLRLRRLLPCRRETALSCWLLLLCRRETALSWKLLSLVPDCLPGLHVRSGLHLPGLLVRSGLHLSGLQLPGLHVYSGLHRLAGPLLLDSVLVVLDSPLLLGLL